MCGRGGGGEVFLRYTKYTQNKPNTQTNNLNLGLELFFLSKGFIELSLKILVTLTVIN